jgi:hypothetical protein
MAARQISDKELEAIIRLPAPKRYDYSIKRVADRNEIWGLKCADGWVVAADDDGTELVPVWPDQRFAALSAADEWAGCEPAAIPLPVWLERWINGMQNDRRQVAVFPIPSNSGIVVAPHRFASDLRKELERVE